MTDHRYQGLCPDENQPNSHDPQCPACQQDPKTLGTIILCGMLVSMIESAPRAVVKESETVSLLTASADDYEKLSALRGKFVAVVDLTELALAIKEKT